jgi:hypothetical protein
MFAFGPWQWPVSNPWQLYSFLFFAQLALLLGYLRAIKKKPCTTAFRVRIPTAVMVSLILNYLWFGEMYSIRSGRPFQLSEFLSAAIIGFTNPGQQYDERMKANVLMMGRQISFHDYISLLLFPLLWITLPLGLFFWKQLNRGLRVAFILWTIFDLLTWIAVGTNQGIADFAILFTGTLIARRPSTIAHLRARKLLAIGLIAIVAVISLATFMSVGMRGRSGGRLVLSFDPKTGTGTDPDNLIMKILPPELQGGYAAITSYFSQGYYALSLSLKEPFVFCYGVGNSFFLEGLSRHLVSTPLINYTYPARIESSSWDRYVRWHSIYPWIASDLSFPGTLIFMFLIGWLFGLVWLDVAFCRNPWAVCLFSLLLIMLFYIPANNQVLAFSPTALPFWTILPIWLFTRTRRNRRRY